MAKESSHALTGIAMYVVSLKLSTAKNTHHLALWKKRCRCGGWCCNTMVTVIYISIYICLSIYKLFVCISTHSLFSL